MSDLSGEKLEIRYVPLGDAKQWDWKENPKKHDTESIINSISRYGFKDPPKYEPEMDAFGHGNGRTHALVKMRDHDLSPPRGVMTDEDGEWHIPVLFGVDAASKKVAEAYAVDHNNLTMAGGDFDATDFMDMWDGPTYEKIAKRLEDQDEMPVTISEDDMKTIAEQLKGNEEESPGEFSSYDEEIETEHTCPKCGYEW